MKYKVSALNVTQEYASLQTYLTFSSVHSEAIYKTYFSLEILQENTGVKYKQLSGNLSILTSIFNHFPSRAQWETQDKSGYI